MYTCDAQPPMSRAFAYAMEEPSHCLELHTVDDKYDELPLEIAFAQAELELDMLISEILDFDCENSDSTYDECDYEYNYDSAPFGTSDVICDHLCKLDSSDHFTTVRLSDAFYDMNSMLEQHVHVLSDQTIQSDCPLLSCLWTDNVRDSTVSLGVMVHKRLEDLSIPIFGACIYFPCYMMPMCYFVPSSQQVPTCTLPIIMGFLQVCNISVDDPVLWALSTYYHIASLTQAMPVTFIGSVNLLWLIAGLWLSNSIEVSCYIQIAIVLCQDFSTTYFGFNLHLLLQLSIQSPTATSTIILIDFGFIKVLAVVFTLCSRLGIFALCLVKIECPDLV